MTDGVLFRTEYFDLVQDINAALVMSQIHYWYMPDKNGKSKLRVYKAGRFWIAKSYAEWWREVRLSRGQVERALKCLERHNLIRVEIFQFNGHPTRHIICDVLSEIPLSKRGAIALLQAFHCTDSCNGLHADVQSITESTSESTTHTLYATVPVAEQEKKMQAAEILKKFEEKKTEGVKGGGVNAMALLWKKRVSLHNEWVKNLLPKEVGQLKHVHTALGSEAVGVLDWALQNWQVFAHEVQVQKGATPAMAPHVGFFCQHWEVAAHLSKKPVVGLQSVAPVPQPTPIKPVHNPGHDEPIATADEVQATLETLAALAAGKKPVG